MGAGGRNREAEVGGVSCLVLSCLGGNAAENARHLSVWYLRPVSLPFEHYLKGLLHVVPYYLIVVVDYCIVILRQLQLVVPVINSLTIDLWCLESSRGRAVLWESGAGDGSL